MTRQNLPSSAGLDWQTWQSTSLPHSFQDGTQTFVAVQGARIEATLQRLLPQMNQRMMQLGGKAAIFAVAAPRYQQAATLWQKFFWLRAAEHVAEDGDTPAQALQHAETDVLALSTLLHPW